MVDYLKQHGTRQTPQTESMRGDQVENSAGGFVWAVDAVTRLRRFLILGSEGGSYYANERDLTKENVDVVRRMAREDGLRLVNEIVTVSEGGHAPKNDPALFALAVAFSLGDKETKLAAGKALPQVARIATHLYHFVAYMETMRGWGRMARKAVSEWYDRNPEQLALQAVKYRQRDGWSHRDLLRLAHPTTSNAETARLFGWITHRETDVSHNEWGVGVVGGFPNALVRGFELAQASQNAAQTASLVREYRLPREALQTEHLTDSEVWRALLDVGMPMTALVRNLATMTRLGVLDGDYRRAVVDSLGNQETIRRSRLHPLAILVALSTYQSGKGFRGSKGWTPIPTITDALDEAFYLAFDNVEATGKSHLLALDVSPSMANGQVAGSPLTPREASVAMALVTLHVEDDVEVVAFAGRLEPLGLSRRQRLDDAVRSVTNIRWNHTDCSLPMLYATQEQKKFDAFFVYTDNETFFGNIHPAQALTQYRERSGIPARLGVVGMVSNGFTIADPNDRGMLDVVGFDTSTPAVLADFAAGRV